MVGEKDFTRGGVSDFQVGHLLSAGPGIHGLCPHTKAKSRAERNANKAFWAWAFSRGGPLFCVTARGAGARF